MAKKIVYTVGPRTEFILHRKDRCNYWPGDVFNLDHVDSNILQILLSTGKVVDVTGKKQTDIDAMVSNYKEIGADIVKAALEASGDLEIILDDEEES